MKKNKGFTLIELMVSISIIAILTALAAVSFTAAQKKARDSRRAQDIKLLQMVAEQYASLSNGVYPGSTDVPWISVGQTILEAIPKDPKNGTLFPYVLTLGTSESYCFCAKMENPSTGNSVDDTCASLIGDTGDYFCAKQMQ